MRRQLTCIECPEGCALSAEVVDLKVTKVSGEKCSRGKKYAVDEVENPVRILTSTVLTEGLSLKMVSVRTNKPIPRSMVFEAMKEIKKIRIGYTGYAGDIIVEGFMGFGVNLIATRDFT